MLVQQVQRRLAADYIHSGSIIELVHFNAASDDHGHNNGNTSTNGKYCGLWRYQHNE